MTDNEAKNNPELDDIKTTNENLSSRSGLAFFPPYLKEIGILERLDKTFGSIRKIDRGLKVREAFKQLICFFVDGTDLSLSRFDELADKTGYRKTIQTSTDQMASSDQIRRFLDGFSYLRNFHFRKVFQDLFVWRIKHEQPDLITLDIDTMVMDNDEAYQREGVDYTYKGVRGFQPLMVKWDGIIVDAVLRRGKKHSNHSDSAHKMIRHLVQRIRSEYRAEVPIIITGDSGFYDGDLFETLEELEVGYVIGGRLEEEIDEFTDQFNEKQWERIQKEDAVYEALEFGWNCQEWKKTRRMVLSRRVDAGGQTQLSFARKRNTYVTNLGMGGGIQSDLQQVGKTDLGELDNLLRLAHGRGDGERTHRCFKEFGTEQLPMIRFEPNNAYFNIMVLAFNLYEAFKADILPEGVLSAECMPSTFRRKLIDVAGKVVKTGRCVYLKVTEQVYDRFHLDEIWTQVNSPPVSLVV